MADGHVPRRLCFLRNGKLAVSILPCVHFDSIFSSVFAVKSKVLNHKLFGPDIESRNTLLIKNKNETRVSGEC